MTTSAAGPRGLHRLRRLTVLIATAILLGVTAASAAASSHNPNTAVASAARTQPKALMSAARAADRADRALVADAKSLARCRRSHPRRCAAQKAALQRAGKTYTARERHLTRVASSTGKAHSSSWHGFLEAPKLTVSGQTLDWSRVPDASTYVVVRHVPGQAAQDTVVSGTSYTPPPVPGVKVGYSVRSTAYFSSWSNEVSISYPKPVETTTTETKTTETKAAESKPAEAVKAPDTQAAPALSVSGQTLEWNAVAGVTDYVLATKAPGQSEQFTEVSGTSFTPPVVAGATVHYSLRTAVEGSAWSSEVAISFPKASETPVTTEEAAPEKAQSTTPSFEPGLNSGSDPTYDIPGAAQLGAKLVRLDLGIEQSPKQFESVIAAYAEKGIRVAPLADFTGTMPTPAEAQNLASWASTYGPGGTFWAHRSDGQLAIRTIEFGNETSYAWQYSNDTPSGYASRAQTYALRFAEAANAIHAANPSVGLLAQGDAGNAGSVWVENMFKAVPNLGQLVAGWTIHPYGTGWKGRFQQLISETAAHGAPSTIPIDVTEWGLATDNGACLTENYGWNPCMTYQEAGEVLTRTVSEMRQTLGSRMGMFMLYQVRDQQTPGATNDREAYFGALQHELQPKGAYTVAAKALMES